MLKSLSLEPTRRELAGTILRHLGVDLFYLSSLKASSVFVFLRFLVLTAIIRGAAKASGRGRRELWLLPGFPLSEHGPAANQQLACECHDGGFAASFLTATDTLD